jgi:hypothetical protein
VWYEANLDQDVQFDKNIAAYFDWIASHDATYHLGTNGATLLKEHDQIQHDLRGHRTFGTFGPSEWNDVFVSAAYDVRLGGCRAGLRGRRAR